MSTFVFSDTHLTKDFDQKKFDKLTSLIEKADNVIIDGDFWEGLMITFDEFINSEWKKLFPLLKQKKAVYVYGNHDNKVFSDDRVYQFCDKAVHEYEFKTPSQTYFFIHGDEFLFPRVEHNVPPKRHIGKESFLTFVQEMLIKVLGPTAFPKKFNEITLEERKAITSMDNLLVCGHTHRPQYQKDKNFVDIGFFTFGWANYMLIDDNGNFELRSEKY